MGKRGDINEDGLIGTLDVTRLLSYLTGVTGLNATELWNADVNNDNNVGIDDVTHMMSNLAGIDGFSLLAPEPDPEPEPDS